MSGGSTKYKLLSRFDDRLIPYELWVLIRQILLKAIEEDAEIFDFGLGDEDFKKQFATNVRTVKKCGMYPMIINNCR